MKPHELAEELTMNRITLNAETNWVIVPAKLMQEIEIFLRHLHPAEDADLPRRLTPMEARLYRFLSARKGAIVPYQEIVAHVADDWRLISFDSLFVHVARLRRKMEAQDWPLRLRTYRDRGYGISAEPIAATRKR